MHTLRAAQREIITHNENNISQLDFRIVTQELQLMLDCCAKKEINGSVANEK